MTEKRFHIRRTDNLELIRALDQQCFPAGNAPIPDDCIWWVAYSEHGSPAGYAGAKPTGSNGVFLARAGVLRAFRGHGLQVRLIRARVRWARSQGREFVHTFTVPWNVASMNSLIRAGFKTFTPSWYWGSDDEGEVYWCSSIK